MIKTDIPIILASASPRRAELLKQGGFTFRIVPSTVKESITENTPYKIVEELAYQKADEVYQRLKKNMPEVTIWYSVLIRLYIMMEKYLENPKMNRRHLTC